MQFHKLTRDMLAGKLPVMIKHFQHIITITIFKVDLGMKDIFSKKT